MTTADYAPRGRDRRCPVHGGPTPCPACQANTAPMPTDWIEETKALLEAGRARLESTNPKETR